MTYLWGESRYTVQERQTTFVQFIQYSVLNIVACLLHENRS